MKEDLMFSHNFKGFIIGTWSLGNFAIHPEYSIEVENPVEVLGEIIEVFRSHFYEKRDESLSKEIYLKKDDKYKWILDVSFSIVGTPPYIDVSVRYENSVGFGIAYREQFSRTAFDNNAKLFLSKLRDYRKILMEDDD